MVTALPSCASGIIYVWPRLAGGKDSRRLSFQFCQGIRPVFSPANDLADLVLNSIVPLEYHAQAYLPTYKTQPDGVMSNSTLVSNEASKSEILFLAVSTGRSA